MSNWKHTTLAFLSVATVISMSVAQYSGTLLALANKYEAEYKVALNEESVEEVEEAFVAASLPETEEAEDAEIEAEEEIEADALEEIVEVFEAKTGYISYVGGSVNIREEASKQSEVVTSLVLGDSFEVTGISEDGLWYSVTLSDGNVGYVMCDLVGFEYDEIKKLLTSTTMYETGIISVSGSKLNVRNAPSETNSVVVDQLADGAVVYIVSTEENGWMKVMFGSDYDCGYIMSKFVAVGDMVKRVDVDNAKKDRLSAISKNGTVVTNGEAVNVRNAPSEKGEAVGSLKNGDACTIISQGSKWTKILYADTTAYIISSAVMDEAALADYNAKKEEASRRAANVDTKSTKAAPAAEQTPTTPATAANSSMGATIIAEGEKYIGTKYVYGGSSPSGFDCSGFVQYVMKKVGITVNRTSRDQYKNGVAVSKENLAAGDLVFFSKGGSISHVGIYAGNGNVLHSPSPGKTVCYTTLEHMCSYSTYVGARRVY